jgi:hypothetical protein
MRLFSIANVISSLLSGIQYSRFEQIESGSSEHRTFDWFQPVYRSFNKAIAPRQGNSRSHRRLS